MKKWTLIFLLLVVANLRAQTNAPVRLAVVSETSEAITAADVLTARFSSNGQIQLLERDQIEKVYREQGMSEANRDDVKIGRILGADGLLLLDVVRTPQTTNLTTRLIAVKPGVVLTDGSFSWPLKDGTQWAESVTTYVDSFLPKLTVLAKDAIPISVVNLRAAISSTDEQETERDLKLLTIQRLSQEPRFFVLERQKMQLLSREKELKSDESTFWDGSYLLDGIVDQNGYSKDTVTINARLTPPKGGAPLSFVVSGSRTNLSEVINRLTAKVTGLLNVSPTVQQWNATNEAAQYYDEAVWALRWGAFKEAQAAAESAWALGKQDMECATMRVRAYMVSPDAGELIIHYPPQKPPDPQNIVFTLHALQLYNELSRNLPPDQPNVDSAWYQLGLENLTVASRVLQVFNWSPDFYEPVAGQLAELRAAARSTAEWISKSPTVHDSYFVGDHTVVYDELYHFEEKPSIFGLEVDCGCLWQETPEDSVVLYRELMSSPVFCYLHDRFWFRDSYHNSSLRMLPPRLIAWNESDQKRIPNVWSNFVSELSASTNVLLSLEAKALLLADAKPGTNLAECFTNFFNAFFENHDTLVANKVEVLYLDWRIGDLVERMGGDEFANEKLLEAKESLRHIYYSEYRPRIEAMDQEYRDKTVFLSTFEKQKQYLKGNTPYDFFKIAALFGSATYSRAQALEIGPLLAAYKSNLVAQSKSASGMQKAELMGAISYVGSIEANADRALHPPTPRPQIQAPKVAPLVKVAAAVPVDTETPEVVTNVVAINKFFAIPWKKLIDLGGFGRIANAGVTITAHHWFEGRLLLDFQYSAGIDSFDEKGKIIGGGNVNGSAIAIFNPETEQWDVVGCPETDTEVDLIARIAFYHRTALFHGELLTSNGGQIRKYDFLNQQWEVLKISDGNNYELFVVNGHLYAANRNIIFEIIDGGKATRILASTRRQPSRSILDTQDLGLPTLFEGPNHSLRVCTANKIFTWTGNDWNEESGVPPVSSQPEIFTDGVLFRKAGFLNAGWQNGALFRQPDGTYGTLASQDEISCLANTSNFAELCLSSGDQANSGSMFRPGANTVPIPKPFWKMPANVLPNLPIASRQSELYLLEDSFAAHVIINDRHQILQHTAERGEYNAALLCFSKGFPAPEKLFLKFIAPDAGSPTWMFPTTNQLFFGSEMSFDNAPGGFFGSGSSDPGIWAVPFSAIESAVAAQKQVQLAQMAQERTQALAGEEQQRKALEQRHRDLLAKYDLNHNGVIDPGEREAALDDSAFIESELDVIDANHNGRLDPAELAYFDANNDKILEPKEQAGIDNAEHLFAEQLMKKFDANDDGVLDQEEFNNLCQSCGFRDNMRGFRPLTVFPVAPENHNGQVDLRELESFLQQQLRLQLRPRGAAGAAFFRQQMAHPNATADPRQMFKAYVEFYWQHRDNIVNGNQTTQ